MRDVGLNIWEQVGNKCLSCALSILDEKTASTAATVEAVRNLVETAIEIDTLNLQWTVQTQSGEAVFGGRVFPPQASKN